MRTSPWWRACAIAVTVAVVLAGCGDDDADTAVGDTTTTAGHDHGSGHEVGDLAPVPAVSVTVDPDSLSGLNVHLETTGVELSGEAASTEHVPGEGHAHVYVDGEKVGRVYTEWYHLDGIDPGEHEVRVELNGNDHAPLLVEGRPVDDTVTVEVPEPGDAHHHGVTFSASDPAPTVSIEVVDDPMSGYNVHVTTTDFTFAPGKVGETDTEPGEGHAHLYLDGHKVARVYGEWYHLDELLEPGEHELRVGLYSNDHRAYVRAGEEIDDMTTIVVEGEPAEDGDAAGTGQVIDVAVAGGAVTGGGRHEVALGDTVTIRVTSDVTDHVHLHGYDVMVDVAAGATADLTFEASIPGIFEVELEDAHLPLLELEIS